MRIWTKVVSDRYVSFRAPVVMDLLQRNGIPSYYMASKGFLVRRERQADAEAAFEDAGHQIVRLRAGGA